MHRLRRFFAGAHHPHRLVVLQTLVVLVCGFMVASANATVVIRFQDRSLFISNSEPGVVADYTVSLTYTTETTVGSLLMEFCTNPMHTEPCEVPAGLDLSGAALAAQTGVDDYAMSIVAPNKLVFSRTPALVGQTPSSYKIDGIQNPAFNGRNFSIRLSDYASTDATGPIIDLGGVNTQTTYSIVLETQVPPVLQFCVASQVAEDCSTTAGGNYADLGTLGPLDTLVVSSQMAVGTNATDGFVIQVFGTSMQAGVNVINAMSSLAPSTLGTRQFGINLVANSDPFIGADPDGPGTNAVVAPDYAMPNQFKFADGDELAVAPIPNLSRRFTISYIVNSSADLRPGVYTTTITYVCTGRF